MFLVEGGMVAVVLVVFWLVIEFYLLAKGALAVSYTHLTLPTIYSV